MGWGDFFADFEDQARAGVTAGKQFSNAPNEFLSDLGSANNLGEAFAGLDDFAQSTERIVDRNIDSSPLGQKWNSADVRQKYGVPIAAALAAYFTGGVVSGAVGGGVTGGVVGGAAGGAAAAQTTATANQQSLSGKEWGNAIGTGAVAGGIGASSNGNPYGYGTSAAGRAGTAATTAGGLAALKGGSSQDQLRNAVMAGGSAYAGALARDAYANTDMSDAPRGVDPSLSSQGTGHSAYYDNLSNSAGKLASYGTNLGLQSLWKDPNNSDMANVFNTMNQARNQLDNSNSIGGYESIQGLQNSPEGSRLLELFEQPTSTRTTNGTVGGSGQWALASDQFKQENQSNYI